MDQIWLKMDQRGLKMDKNRLKRAKKCCFGTNYTYSFAGCFLFAELGCTPLPPFAENIFDRNNFANISLNPQNSI